MMRLLFLTLFATFVGSCCEKEVGLYINNDRDEVRLNGIVISELEYAELITDSSKADMKVTVIEDGQTEYLTLGEFHEVVESMVDEVLSSKEPEAFYQSPGPDEEYGGVDPFSSTKPAEQEAAGQSATDE